VRAWPAFVGQMPAERGRPLAFLLGGTSQPCTAVSRVPLIPG